MTEKHTLGIGPGQPPIETAIVGEKRIAAVNLPPTLVSILVPCCGMIEYTKLCVPSILQHVRKPIDIEMIFLDIGSLDGTAEYLAGVKAACRHRVEIVRTQSDLGIGDACKEAIEAARGEYLMLLNNDTVVTEGWLHQLVSLAGLSEAIGMVGPMSNYASPPQLVETVPYRVKPKRAKNSGRFGTSEALVDVAAVNAFAREHREKMKSKWVPVERLGGFCVLVKRTVIDKIGRARLDEWTDLRLFDSDILSAKARQVGFTLACCRDLFIHHFGTRTFSQGAPNAPEKPKDRAAT